MPAGSQCPQSTRILRRLMTMGAPLSVALDYCQSAGQVHRGPITDRLPTNG
jgi:hypothetical protein